MRRNLALKPKSSDIRRKINEKIRELEGKKDLNTNIYSEISIALKNFSVDQEDFKRALRGPVYEVNSSTTRFLLTELEREYGKSFNKSNTDNLDELNEKGTSYVWTLEHILPNKPEYIKENSAWYKIRENIKNDKDASEIIDKSKHKIGNITLTAYNSELSNKDFKYKRDYKDGETYTGLRHPFYINKSIPDDLKNETIETKKNWTIEDIERRTETLIEKILELFDYEE